MPRPVPDKKKLLNEYFISKNVEIIEPSYPFSCNTLVSIKCKNNKKHVYKISITQIRSQNKDVTVCPHCIREKIYNEMGIPSSVMKDYCDKNNLDYEPKKQFYSRWIDTVTFICKSDGYKHQLLSLRNFEQNTINKRFECPECEQAAKGLLTTDEYDKIMEKIVYTPIIYEKESVNIDFVLDGEFKRKIDNQNKWTVKEFINTKQKCKVICNDCGAIKECLPFSLFDHDKIIGCKNCLNNFNKSRVYTKIKNLLIKSNLYPTETGNDIFKHSENEPIKIKCNNCGHNFERYWNNINDYEHLNCPNCFGSTKRRSQSTILDFITKQLKLNAIQNDRTNGFEIDIYVPDLKFGIEYNGLIWHSTRFKKDINAHKLKLEKCEDIGIRLLTIFEDEWLNNKSSCCETIGGLLNKEPKNIENPIIKIIDIDSAEEFFNKHSIKSFDDNSNCCHGLLVGNKLIAVISLDIENDDYLIMTGFCFDSDYDIKTVELIFDDLKRIYKDNKLISTIDLRLESLEFYKNVGFQITKRIEPNFYYYGKPTDFNRYSQEVFKDQYYTITDSIKDDEKIKAEESVELYRIYDCGSIVVEKDL